MRRFGIVFGLLTSALVIALGTSLIPKMKQSQNPTFENEQQAKEYDQALKLLDAGKHEEALEIVHKYKSEIEKLDEKGIYWLELFIRGSEETKDIPQLTILFEFFPEIFKEHENSSLLVADYYLANNQVKDYKKIRSIWEDRETQVAAWFVLDVDQLLLDGRRAEAADLLKSRTFKDKADVGRLVRLALLYADEDPKTSWQYLGEAYSKDPQNVDIRFYRARLLETAGKYSLAHNEYQAAVRLNPKDVFLKDLLAEFYIRQKQYPLALNVWKDSLSPPSIDKIWLKALFYGKLTKPLDFNWEETAVPQGRLEPLVQYIVSLDDGVFWNDEKFEKIPNANYYLKTQQETFWLRLLHALKDRNEKLAGKLLKYNTFMASSWYPELETAFKRVLAYRTRGTLEIEGAQPSVPLILGDRLMSPLPPLLEQLEVYAASGKNGESVKAIPQELDSLLRSNEIFSALLLQAGWNEAGLQLHQLPIIPKDFPDWVAYNLTQAFHQNRSTMEALQFASLQKPSPEQTLVTAELLIAGGDSIAALEKLNTLVKLDTDVGFKAAWLASLIYIEQKEWKQAKNTVISQPKLISDILGKETLARIAHLEGDKTLADKLYAGIEKESPEARSYLARKAFAERNWERAKELTEKLITDYPDNPMLRKNLDKIKEEQDKLTKLTTARNSN